MENKTQDLKVIVTGSTGMVGEGVMLTCLESPVVNEVLMVNRKHYDFQHPKLKELIVPDFMNLDAFVDQLKGYDACFYCAGISSVGMSEEKYTHITYDTTMSFAKRLSELNDDMVFTFVTGSSTDSSEKGNTMWARVKGKTENDLSKLPFKGEYNFRPGVMRAVKGQKNANRLYMFIAAILVVFIPKKILTLEELGTAMIKTITRNYPNNILEIADIKTLAAS